MNKDESIIESIVNPGNYDRYRRCIIEDGVLYCYGGEEKNIKIPNGTHRIANSVFTREGLNSVVFPKSLTIINDRAFANNHLTKVEFPSSLHWYAQFLTQ